MRKFVWLVLALAMFVMGCAQVDSGEVGVKTSWGKVVQDDLEPGLHAITLIKDAVEPMSVKTVAHVTPATTAVSRDLQEVTTQVTVNYSLNPEYAGEVFAQYRRNFETTVLSPTVQEAIKTVTAQYNVDDLLAQRALVKEKLFAIVSERLAPTHKVEAVMLTDFSFSDEFAKAIEIKVTALQNSLAEKNKLETVKFQAEQRITNARAEAEAIRIQAQAITSSGGEDYVKLKWIEAWGKGGAHVPQFMGANDNTMFMLNLSKGK